jgi:hypothetical protein
MLVAIETTTTLLGLILAPIAVVVLLLFFWAHQVRTERMKHWRALAHRHELQMSGNVTLWETVLSGQLGGVETKIWLGGCQDGRSMAICTHIQCKIPGTMPPGMRVVTTSTAGRLQQTKKMGKNEVLLDDPELDALLKCQSLTPIKLRQLMTDDLVKPLLLKKINSVRFLEISIQVVKVEVTGIAGAKLPQIVEEVSSLAIKLAEAYEAPYAQLSGQLGLLYKSKGSDERLMRGVWEGIRVIVRLGRDQDPQSRYTTTIQMGMDSGLPAQFRLIPRRLHQVEHGYAQILNQELAQLYFASGIPQVILNLLVKSDEIRNTLIALHQDAQFVTIEQGELIVIWHDLLGYEIREKILLMGGLVLIIRKQISEVSFP